MAITVLQGTTYRMLLKDARTLDIDLSEGETVLITLAKGRAFGEAGSHIRGFENWEAACNAVRRSIECQCPRCTE